MRKPSDVQAGRIKMETRVASSDPGGLSSARPRGGTGCGRMDARRRASGWGTRHREVGWKGETHTVLEVAVWWSEATMCAFGV